MFIIPTILCGGAGSRLWPISRELHPKPFIRLNDEQSLLQKAFLRAASVPNVTDILTITNRELFFKTQDEYRELNTVHSLSYILEPFGQNTAAAITIAALHVAQTYGDDAILLILPADHLVNNQAEFQKIVYQAALLAKKNKLVTLGVQPHAPEIGYGYIHANLDAPLILSEPINQTLGFEVFGFHEKPSLHKAKEYIASGNYLWNAGIFCFTAAYVLQNLERYSPDIYNTAQICMNQSLITQEEQTLRVYLDAETFAQVPNNSFDYAVMEPAASSQSEYPSSVAVVPCDIAWSDIGSWQALGDLSTADAQGNQIDGHSQLHDTTNCYIQSRERLIGTVGIDNLVIIDTPDALLVAHKDRVQDVKHLYTELKAKGHEVHKLHRTVHRPWGTYTVLEEGLNFKIKRIEVNAGASLSLQMHHHRSEHWIVVSGMARVTNGDNNFLLNMNESTYIPAGNEHRLENPGILKLIMIEVQSGEYLGEDDIVRLEDNYGRIQEVK
ncbi:MAG: mannose-1-phosphate guanylyltransferase/mannose-6-phosphate isomerase [Legionellaceae bacterium]|nr:mannose-1-phosphate guanylyltransferase/mannose-6-phosphate isomerase [Legionellaceae bacterium]